MNLGILGVPEGRYVSELASAATRLGFDCEIFQYADLAAGIVDRKSQFITSSSDLSPSRRLFDLDALVIRSMPLGSLEQVIFRMDALQALVDHGVTVLNPPKLLETAIDKWLTTHRLYRAGVPTPRTIACQTRSQAIEAFQLLGNDVLLKPLFGGEGRGIIRIQDDDMAWRAFGAIAQLGQVFYLQEFIPNAGYDIRILFVGERWYSIKRDGGADWRTNVSQGATPSRYAPKAKELELAKSAVESLGDFDHRENILGVDLLPGNDGELYVLEVNAVPGWKGVSQTHDDDLAQVLVQHVRKLVS